MKDKIKADNLIAIEIPKRAKTWLFTSAQDFAILFYDKEKRFIALFDMDKYIKVEKGTDGKMYHYPPNILGVSKHHDNKLLVEIQGLTL